MLTHPTLDTLHNLGLYGLAKGFKELANNAGAAGLEHAEWLGIILEHEVTLRRDKRFQARMRAARLRQTATIEDVDLKRIAVLIAPCCSNWQPAPGSRRNTSVPET